MDPRATGRISQGTLIAFLISNQESQAGPNRSNSRSISKPRRGNSNSTSNKIHATTKLPTVKAITPQKGEMLLNKLRQLVHQQGVTGLLDWQTECSRIQDSHGVAPCSVLHEICHTRSILLTKQEIEWLAMHLESTHYPACLSLRELCYCLKGSLEEHQRDALTDMFNKLNFKGGPTVDIRVMGDIFSASTHPAVKEGSASPQAVESMFRRAIRVFIRLQQDSPHVRLAEFLGFWEILAPTFRSPHHLTFVVVNCFKYRKLPHKERYNEPEVERFERKTINMMDVSRLAQIPPAEGHRMHDLFNKMRSYLSKHGYIGYSNFYSKLRHNDYDQDAKITLKELIKTFKDCDMLLPDEEVAQVFAHFDKNRSGFVAIPHLMCEFIPKLDTSRQKVVSDLLTAIASEEDANKIPITTFKKFFFPKGHLGC